MKNYNSMNGLPSTPEAEPLSALRLKHLDMAMEQSRLLASGVPVPPELTSALEENSQALGVPPALLYDDLIATNPLDTPDVRTFLQGEEREQEIFFYKVHREIEETLSEGVRVIEESLKRPDRFPYSLVDALDAGITCVRKTIASMHQLNNDFSPEIFSRLRPFFTNPKPFPGPSGKFSSGMFCLDTLCIGNESVLHSFLESKMKSLQFFPRTSLASEKICGVNDMERLFHNYSEICSSNSYTYVGPFGGYIPMDSYRKLDLKRTALSQRNESLNKDIQELLSLIQQVRGIHASTIMRFIPEAREGHGTGTAGEDIQNHIRRYRDAYREACSLK